MWSFNNDHDVRIHWYKVLCVSVAQVRLAYLQFVPIDLECVWQRNVCKSGTLMRFILRPLKQFHLDTVVSQFLVPIAHCTLQSLTKNESTDLDWYVSWYFWWHLAREAPTFQYFYHMNDCSVQCAYLETWKGLSPQSQNGHGSHT